MESTSTSAGTFDWNAFWVSLGIVLVALLAHEMLLKPLIKKYSIQVIKDAELPAQGSAPTKA